MTQPKSLRTLCGSVVKIGFSVSTARQRKIVGRYERTRALPGIPKDAEQPPPGGGGQLRRRCPRRRASHVAGQGCELDAQKLYLADDLRPGLLRDRNDVDGRVPIRHCPLRRRGLPSITASG